MDKNDRYDLIVAACAYLKVEPITYEQFRLFHRFGVIERKHERLRLDFTSEKIGENEFMEKAKALHHRAQLIAGQLGLRLFVQGNDLGSLMLSFKIVRDNDMGDFTAIYMKN